MKASAAMEASLTTTDALSHNSPNHAVTSWEPTRLATSSRGYASTWFIPGTSALDEIGRYHCDDSERRQRYHNPTNEGRGLAQSVVLGCAQQDVRRVDDEVSKQQGALRSSRGTQLIARDPRHPCARASRNLP
jgi:hypothetical protein